MELPGWLNYDKQMRKQFGTLTTIQEMCENIFKAYPVRVRTQQSITYYEIGARNIDGNGDIVVQNDDVPKEHANITAFEAQVLQEGDILLPFRNKRFRAGLFRHSETPMIPNPSLLVIRTGSLLKGRYLLVCLRQPFIIGYLEYLALRTGKVGIEDVASLEIPAFDATAEKYLDRLEMISMLRHRMEKAVDEFRLYEAMYSGQVLVRQGDLVNFDKLKSLDRLLDNVTDLSTTLKRSIISQQDKNAGYQY